MRGVKITDWDDAYANRAHIPDAESYPPRWEQAAAAFRAGFEGTDRLRRDIAYGQRKRETMDLFLPEAPARGLFVFVHGGYWRAFGKDDWSHLAKGALARGYAAVLPGYRLCPKVHVTDITAAIAKALGQAAALVSGPIYLAGHSAGGHLVTRMVCAQNSLAPGVQARIARVLSISGVHDLRPLIRTEINKDLRLDPAEAQRESPALLSPREGARVICAVGSDERPEFLRQSALLANIWIGCGAETELMIRSGEHHFNVIDSLADPESPMLDSLFRS